jgi:CheY-like chemotaxis protein
MALRILLVEDDNSTRKLFAQLLEHHGYEVSQAENGRAAMQQMQRQPANLVITDMIMPVMDGVDTIVAVRREYPDVKIIAVSESGFSPAENCLKIARALGSHRTLTKPLDPRELLNTIRELVG